MNDNEIMQIFMNQWEQLMAKKKAYLKLTDNKMGLVDDLLDQDPGITKDGYTELLDIIEVVYSVANGLDEIDRNPLEIQGEREMTLLEQVNRLPKAKLSKEVADAILLAATIDEDEILNEILELKGLLDTNELAQEIIRWGKEDRENREGKDELNLGIH
jgi:hypothetical protein